MLGETVIHIGSCRILPMASAVALMAGALLSLHPHWLLSDYVLSATLTCAPHREVRVRSSLAMYRRSSSPTAKMQLEPIPHKAISCQEAAMQMNWKTRTVPRILPT